jgi:hypothetical protein
VRRVRARMRAPTGIDNLQICQVSK